MSPEQVIRSVRLRIVGCWAAGTIGIAFSFGIGALLQWISPRMIPSPSLLAALSLWPFLAIAFRLRSMPPTLPPLSLGGAIVICASAALVAFASVYLAPESGAYVFPAAVFLAILSVLVPDLLAFRTPLRLVSEDDRKKLYHA